MTQGGAELGRAVFTLDTDLQGFVRGLQQARTVAETEVGQIGQVMRAGESAVSSSANSMGEQFKGAAEKASGFAETLGEISRIALGFSVATTVVGIVDQIAEAMRGAADAARDLAEQTLKLQAITGAGAQEASAQIAFWERYGVSVGGVERSLTTLSRAIEGFSKVGSNDAGAAALEKLGVAITDVNGKQRDLIQIQDDVIDRLRQMPEGAERNTTAMALLGRTYQQLAPLFRATADEIDHARESSQKASLTDEEQAALIKWSTSIKDVSDSFTHLGNTLAYWISGPGKQFADWLSQTIDKTGTFVEKLIEMNLRLGETIAHGAYPYTGSADVLKRPVTTIEEARATGFALAPEEAAGLAGGVAGKVVPPDTGLQAAKALADARKVYAEEEIKQIREAITATNDKYTREIELAKNAYQQELDAAKTHHEGVLEQLKQERQAAQDNYDAAVQAARNAEAAQLDEEKKRHQGALDDLTAEREAVKAKYDADRVDLQVARQAELDDAKNDRDSRVAALQQEQEEVKRQRQAADYETRQSQQDADHERQQAHETRLHEIQSEGDARQKVIQDEIKAVQDASKAALRALDDEAKEFQQAHAGRLATLQQEQQALQDGHQAALQAIQREQQAAQDQHQANQRALQDEQQALRDAHDQRLKDLTAQEDAARKEHDTRTRDLKDEQDAEHRLLDDQLRAIQTRTDADQRSLQAQLAAIDAQKRAADEARQQRTDQQTVARAQQQLAQDVGLGGDPTRVLADQQALANALYDVQARQQDQQRQDEKAAIQQQIQDLKTASDAERQALQETQRRRDEVYKTQIEQLDDGLRVELDALLQQRNAENDEFNAHLREIQDRVAAEQDRYDAAIRLIAGERDAENERYQQALRVLQQERDAENAAARDFTETMQKRRQAVQDTTTARLDALHDQSNQEKQATQDALRQEQGRYADETYNIQRTREIAKHELDVERQAQDDTSKAAIQAVNDQYINEQKRIADTYDNPKTGLFVQLDQALKVSTTNLTDRTTAENAHYDNTNARIKETYENTDPKKGALGLIPTLKRAYDETKRNLDLRTTEETAHYGLVQTAIKDTYYNNDDPDNPKGLIPAAEKAKKDIIAHLTEEITNWQTWSTQVVGEVDKVTAAYDRVEKAANAAADAAARLARAGGATTGTGGGGGGTGGLGQEQPIPPPEPPVQGPGMPHLAGNWEAIAESQLGAPYKFGGNSPQGFDCLVAGTMILTSRGAIPIEQVQAGDYVLARRGYRRVERSWLVRRDASIYEVQLASGRVLEGTADHRVWTENRGWAYLSTLTPADTLLGCLSTLSISEDGATTVIRDRQSDPHGSTTSVLATLCTELFGEQRTGRSRQATRSTIRTRIRSTTLSTISNALRDRRIESTTRTTRFPTSKSALGAGEPSRLDLTARAARGSGVVSAASGPGTGAWAIDRSGHASTAARPSRRASTRGTSFARTDAPRLLGSSGAPKSARVLNAAFASLRPSRQPQRSAALLGATSVIAGAKPTGRTADVYDLSVADEHEFFANGVLVHNCGGYVSWVYGHAGAAIPMGTENIQSATYRISASEAQPGDIVMYNMSNPDPHIQHAALFLGGTQIIEAGGVGPKRNQVQIDTVTSVGTPDYRRLRGWDQGGLITHPTLLVDAASLRPYGMMAENRPEWIVPQGGTGAPAGNTSPVFQFNLNGVGLRDMVGEVRRDFERSSWLHGGWR